MVRSKLIRPILARTGHGRIAKAARQNHVLASFWSSSLVRTANTGRVGAFMIRPDSVFSFSAELVLAAGVSRPGDAVAIVTSPSSEGLPQTTNPAVNVAKGPDHSRRRGPPKPRAMRFDVGVATRISCSSGDAGSGGTSIDRSAASWLSIVLSQKSAKKIILFWLGARLAPATSSIAH
ncbi:unnamed protein product [Phytophthora fragariaefolia]|uniref:Unnamed protein product n=1 Tax=Phytophthora fragariaefolia TaxID=1490495 RepID=A0A9W7D8M4_9STRA|nr:unnamed protein product [Phytophthora fragariaefolia]